MNVIKVSVIVPVYNVEKYIDKCLNSLINQTLDEIEIIIVNDGSTDSSKTIINKYLEKYPLKIKYFEKENGGLSSARNFGLKYANGEYIAFLDSDDYIENDMYEVMYNKAQEELSDFIECDFLWQYSNKIKKDRRKKYKTKKEILERPRVVAWNKLIKRDIIEKNQIKFPEGLIYEDLEFFYKLIPYINKISYVDRFFVHYIQRDESISNLKTEKISDIFKVLENIIKYYKDMGIYEEYNKELSYMYRRILLGSSMKRILKLKDKKLKKYLIKKTILSIIYKEKNRHQMLKAKKNRYQMCWDKKEPVLNCQK